MEEKGPGSVNLVYSIIFSRGIERIREDMQTDTPLSLVDPEDKVNEIGYNV